MGYFRLGLMYMRLWWGSGLVVVWCWWGRSWVGVYSKPTRSLFEARSKLNRSGLCNCLNAWVMYDVRCLFFGLRKGRKGRKRRKWACALRSLGFLHGYFLSHRNCRKHRNLFFLHGSFFLNSHTDSTDFFWLRITEMTEIFFYTTWLWRGIL